MRVLVLGGYGLIGSHVVTRLLEAGHAVVGLGRDIAQAQGRFPEARWISADLGRLLTPEAWQPILRDAAPDAIVNAAGLLQDGARDRVADVQVHAMRALYGAATAQGTVQFVQISATRAAADAATSFMRTKGEADAALAQSALEWTVLRPGLVLSPQAYGGTAVVRALAAMPWVMPVACGTSTVQTVAAADVAQAVLMVLERRVQRRRDYDLVVDEAHTMRELQVAIRSWIGLPPVPTIDVPAWLVRAVAVVADALGWLGWRSPFRSTAVTELAAGVRGDPVPWRTAAGRAMRPLAATLRSLPSTVQERWFARAFLAKPLAIGTLSLFWLVTGLLTLLRPSAAMMVLTERGLSAGMAGAIAIAGALADIALGLGILVKATSARAAQGMILVTIAYLVGGTFLTPDLWLDPLGPLVKAVPAMVLAAVLLALEGDR